MNVWESLARRWMAARIQTMNSPYFPAYSPSISLPFSMLRHARAPDPYYRLRRRDILVPLSLSHAQPSSFIQQFNFRAPDAIQFILEGKPKCLQGRILVLIMPRLRQPPNLECNSLHFLSPVVPAACYNRRSLLKPGDHCSEVYNLIGNADAFLAQNSGKLRGRCACQSCLRGACGPLEGAPPPFESFCLRGS